MTGYMHSQPAATPIAGQITVRNGKLYKVEQRPHWTYIHARIIGSDYHAHGAIARFLARLIGRWPAPIYIREADLPIIDTIRALDIPVHSESTLNWTGRRYRRARYSRGNGGRLYFDDSYVPEYVPGKGYRCTLAIGEEPPYVVAQRKRGPELRRCNPKTRRYVPKPTSWHDLDLTGVKPLGLSFKGGRA